MAEVDKIINKTLDKFGALIKRGASLAKDSLSSLRPLDEKEKATLRAIKPLVSAEEYIILLNLIKQNKAKVRLKKLGLSFLIAGNDLQPEIISEDAFAQQLNKNVEEAFHIQNYKDFAERAWQALPQYLGPDIIGWVELKQATALQLFCKEPFDILLAGGSDETKTRFMKSYNRLIKQDAVFDFSKGLYCVYSPKQLSAADKKALSEELLTESRITEASLLVSVKDLEGLPLPRFNILFFIQAQKLAQFAEMAEQIILQDRAKIQDADIWFLQRYIRYARHVEVELPIEMAERIKQFVLKLKDKETELAYPLSPAVVEGIVRLIKASARIDLRTQVGLKDLDRVFNIYSNSLIKLPSNTS